MTNNIINDIKLKVSFISLLELHGWHLVKKKSTRRSLTFSNGSEHIYLYPARNSTSFDNAFYTNRFTNQKGDLIQFLIDQQVLTPQGPIDSFGAAINYLKTLTNLPEPSFSTQVKPKGPFVPYRLYSPSQACYLIQRRSIDPHYLGSDLFKKSVFQIKKPYSTPYGLIYANIFPYYINGKIHGQELRNHEWHHFVENSNVSQSIWHSRLLPDVDFYIAESPIDAISYGQLHDISEGVFISSGGSVSQHQMEAMFMLYNKLAGKHIFLLGDNDHAGARFNLTILLNLLHQQLGEHYLIQKKGQQLFVFTQLAEPYITDTKVYPAYTIDDTKVAIQDLVNQLIKTFQLNMSQIIPDTEDFNQDLQELSTVKLG